MFRGREVFHPELGKKILDRIADQMDGMGKPESVPRLDGRNMVMVLAPDKRAKQSAASRGPKSANEKPAGNNNQAPTNNNQPAPNSQAPNQVDTPAATATPVTETTTETTTGATAGTEAPAAATPAAAAPPEATTGPQPAQETSETAPAPTETSNQEER
jgi:translation initiation factor IF-3